MNEKRKIGIINITVNNFMAKIVFFVFLFFAGFYASRVMNTEDFGKAQYITWTVNFSWLLFNLGGVSVLQRYVASAFMKHRKSELKRYFQFGIVAFLTSLLITISVWFAYKFINPDARQFPLTGLFLILQFAANYVQALAQSFFQFKQLFRVNVITAIIGIALLLLFLPIYNISAYIGMYIVTNAVQIILLSIVCYRAYKNLQPQQTEKSEPETWNTLLKTALYFGISSVLAAVLWQRSETFFIKNFLGFTEIAMYTIALNVIALAGEPLKMIPSVLLSYFAGISHLKDKVEAQFYAFFKHFSWLVIFAGVFIWFEAEALLKLMYTEKFIDAVPYIRILLIGMIPGICSFVLMNMHVGLRRAKFLVIQDTIAAVLFIAFAWWGITNYELVGLAWAKTIVLLFTVTIGMIYTSFRLKFALPIKALLFSLILSIIIFGLLNFIIPTGVLALFIKLIIAAILYCLLSFKFKIIDREVAEKVWKEITSRMR